MAVAVAVKSELILSMLYPFLLLEQCKMSEPSHSIAGPAASPAGMLTARWPWDFNRRGRTAKDATAVNA